MKLIFFSFYLMNWSKIYLESIGGHGSLTAPLYNAAQQPLLFIQFILLCKFFYAIQLKRNFVYTYFNSSQKVCFGGFLITNLCILLVLLYCTCAIKKGKLSPLRKSKIALVSLKLVWTRVLSILIQSN